METLNHAIEVNNPLLLFIISNYKNLSYEEQYDNMYQNKQTIVTGFDYIFKDILYKTADNSYFLERINKNKDNYSQKKNLLEPVFLDTLIFLIDYVPIIMISK